MKKIYVCLLAAFACMWNIPANAKMSVLNFNYTVPKEDIQPLRVERAEGFPALELKAISGKDKFAIKTAAVKSLVGMNRNDDFGLNEEALCIEQGYNLTSCPSGQMPADICPSSPTGSYFRSCRCDLSIYPEIGSEAQAKAACGNLATIETCSAGGVSYYKCGCDTSGKSTCSGADNYTGNVDFCTYNGEKYYENGNCHSCPSPQIVNDTDDGCTCPSSWATCGANQKGNGSVCTADGGDKYVSCSCPSTYKECNSENFEQGTNACKEGTTTLYETCSCPSGWTTCDRGGGAGAKKCHMNGIDYWSSCLSCDNLGTFTAEIDCTTGGYLCTKEACSNKWYRTGCATNSIDLCSNSQTDCASLGYTQTSCEGESKSLKCPYDTSKLYCIQLNGKVGNYYYVNGTLVGVIISNKWGDNRQGVGAVLALKDASTTTQTQSSASSLCNSFATGGLSWSLPSEEEARSIAMGNDIIGAALTEKGGQKPSSDDYWTSSPYADPNTGQTYYNVCDLTQTTCGIALPSSKYKVRCIGYY